MWLPYNNVNIRWEVGEALTDIEKISVGIHDGLVSIIDTLSLPTNKTLMKSFKYSLALTGVSLLSDLLGFYTFISWQGALLCTCLLFMFMYMERRESNELLRMYGSAKLRVEETLRWAKNAGSSFRTGRNANVVNQSSETSGEGRRSDDDEQA